MKNFRKVLSKTVASVCIAHTYGFAIRGYLIKGVAKTLGKFYQTTGMRSIPEHRIKRGVAL